MICLAPEEPLAIWLKARKRIGRNSPDILTIPGCIGSLSGETRLDGGGCSPPLVSLSGKFPDRRENTGNFSTGKIALTGAKALF
jgi:hypothetical protein